LITVEVRITVDLTTFDLVTVNVSITFGSGVEEDMAVTVIVGMGRERQLHPARIFRMANACNADGRAIFIRGVLVAGTVDVVNSARSWASRDRFRFGPAGVPLMHEEGPGPYLKVLC